MKTTYKTLVKASLLAVVGILFLPLLARSGEPPASAEVARLVKAYAFSVNSNLNPRTEFPLQEFKIKGLWEQMHLQLWDVKCALDQKEFCPFNVLYHDTNIVTIGCSVGGYGMMSGLVLSNAFYYTYSWGSGVHRSHVGKLVVAGGKLKFSETGGFTNKDLFVGTNAAGAVRVFAGTFRHFNDWSGTEFGSIAPATDSELRLIAPDGSTQKPSLPWPRIGDSAIPTNKAESTQSRSKAP
jgi:hypothetical protein